jgi:hypothetical protein
MPVGLAAVSRLEEAPMATELRNISEEYQKLGLNGFDATMRSYGEAAKGLQACAAEVTDYSKRAFDDCLRAWEQLLGARSIDQAVQIQSQYVKHAFDAHVAEMAKLGEMVTQMTRHAYAPIEQNAARRQG